MNCVICHRSGESIRNDEIAAEIARHEERERIAVIVEKYANGGIGPAQVKVLAERIRNG